MRSLSPGLPPLLFLPLDFLTTSIILIGIAVMFILVLSLFKHSLYNRLSTRITIIIFISGFVTIILAVAFNQITRDTLSPLWLRQIQITLIVVGGPIILGLLAARFIQRPLRQFNDAIASLEKNDNKVHLQPTGIQEFDEVFTKFNSLIHRLQHEERLRKDLVSDTSHELNTPLTIMIGQLTAIQEGKYPMTEERVSILKEQAERLVELVQQLDTYTKARIPDADHPENIHFDQFCKELTKHFTSEIKEKGITVHLNIPKACIISANRRGLQQIFTNLMQNALRYSAATEISITATPRKIVFADNGKGVPSQSLPYLFERFYRVDTSRSKTTGGLGLGLAIVKEVSEQQGWRIHAENSHPGLTFVIALK